MQAKTAKLKSILRKAILALLRERIHAVILMNWIVYTITHLGANMADIAADLLADVATNIATDTRAIVGRYISSMSADMLANTPR